MTGPTREEVDIVDRLLITAPEDREMPNHRMRRYQLERFEASRVIKALRERLEAVEAALTEASAREAAAEALAVSQAVQAHQIADDLSAGKIDRLEAFVPFRALRRNPKEGV